MELDREPGNDPRERVSPETETRPDDGAGSSSAGTDRDARPGRHESVETDDSDAFWTEVDGMLTGEFSADLLPKDGDYRLGAIHDTFAASDGSPQLDRGDPFQLDEDAAGSGRVDMDALPSPPAVRPGRGAHDLDPERPGVNADTAATSRPAEAVDGPDATSVAVPPVSTESARLLSDAGTLPVVEARDGGRLFPTDPPPTVSPPGPPLGLPPELGGQGPLFDPTRQVYLSTQSGEPSPATLERSNVVDPVQGARPGSTFLEGDLSPAARLARVTGPQPAINLERTAASSEPSGHWQPPSPPSYASRSILLDVVDRQWITSGLVVVAALSIGVIGWIVLLGRDDGGGGELVAASTTLPEPASPSTEDGAAAASAGAGTGGFRESTSTTAATTETTEPETTRRATTAARPQPTRRARPTTAAPTARQTSPPTTSSSTPSTTSSTPTSGPLSTTTPTTVAPTTSSTQPDVTIASTTTTTSTTSSSSSSSSSTTQTSTTSTSSTSESTVTIGGGAIPPSTP